MKVLTFSQLAAGLSLQDANTLLTCLKGVHVQNPVCKPGEFTSEISSASMNDVIKIHAHIHRHKLKQQGPVSQKVDSVIQQIVIPSTAVERYKKQLHQIY